MKPLTLSLKYFPILVLFALASVSAPAHYVVVRVKINPSIQNKEALIGLYSQALEFPSYCGYNWDGFEECLNDLSWFQRDEHVILEHKGMPKLSGADLQIYLRIIRDAAASHQAGRHPIELLFE